MHSSSPRVALPQQHLGNVRNVDSKASAQTHRIWGQGLVTCTLLNKPSG